MAKVLIADDQANMRALVRLTLETGRFDIFEAHDGDAALGTEPPAYTLH